MRPFQLVSTCLRLPVEQKYARVLEDRATPTTHRSREEKAARFSRNPSIFAETGNPNGMGMDMGNMGMDMGNMGMGMGAGTTGMGEHVGGYKTHGY